MLNFEVDGECYTAAITDERPANGTGYVQFWGPEGEPLYLLAPIRIPS